MLLYRGFNLEMITCYFRPVHGLIFLFRYLQDDEPPQPIVTDDRADKIYFAKQVIVFKLLLSEHKNKT